jgi:enamine deaminase RidA (YjgF/YER057c/UK114 family)
MTAPVSTVEDRLSALGLEIPAAAAPAANYVPFVLDGDHLHIAGQIPFQPDGSLLNGRLGADLDVAGGQAAARRCALGLIAQMKAALGSLERVGRIVKLNVFVSSTPDFTHQPEVANGASDLMVAAFGDAGKHARSAVGVAVLPRGVAVEIDAIVAVR